MTFKELELKQEILDALDKLGFVEPTPIQQQAIPVILNEGGDIVGLAQTGTGKTAAFGLPMIHLIDFDSRKTQGLVIAPTRELCIQISKDLEKFAANFKKSNIVPIYGGASIETQTRQLRDGAQIIVATPGRLMDMIRRKKADLSHVAFVALDEADEMLNMGFKEDIDSILSETPADKRTWLFSATMPKEVAQIAKKYMKSPAEISVGTKNSGNENIEHIYYKVDDRDRYNALKRVIDYHPDIFGLIFCRTRRETQQVAESLIKDGYSADPLHGDLSQAQRDSVMRKFRSRTIQILVATDVAARGIDIDDISHVINYNLPDEIESYTHRSGRTARAGRKGTSIIIINSREERKIGFIEKVIKTNVKLGVIPSGEEVCEKQLLHLVDKVVETEVKEDQIQQYIPAILEKFEGKSKEEIIKSFVSLEFNKFLSYYKNSRDINFTGKSSGGDRDSRGRGRDRDRDSRGRGRDRDDRGRGRDRNSDVRSDRGSDRGADRGRDRGADRGVERKSRRRESGSEDGFNRNLDENSSTVFINLGSNIIQDKGHLIRIICEEGGIAGKNVGRIRMMEKFSFIDLAPQVAEKVVKNLNGSDVEGKSVRVEISND